MSFSASSSSVHSRLSFNANSNSNQPRSFQNQHQNQMSSDCQALNSGVALDSFNCDLYVTVSRDGTLAYDLGAKGFQNLWGGIRATHGLIAGKVKLVGSWFPLWTSYAFNCFEWWKTAFGQGFVQRCHFCCSLIKRAIVCCLFAVYRILLDFNGFVLGIILKFLRLQNNNKYTQNCEWFRNKLRNCKRCWSHSNQKILSEKIIAVHLGLIWSPIGMVLQGAMWKDNWKRPVIKTQCKSNKSIG